MGDQLREIEGHVGAGIGLPKGSPLTKDSKGRCSLRSRQASPSASGVTATGEKALERLRLEETETLARVPPE